MVYPGVNIKELVEMVQYDLTSLGINLSWKLTQMKDLATQITIYGVDDNHCSKGCLQEAAHWMKLAEHKLIKNGKQSEEFDEVPLPVFTIFFKNKKEEKLPPTVYDKERIRGIKSFDKDRGERFLVLECSPQDLT